MARDPHATASSRLHAVGQRYTPNRRTIVEILAKASHPLTIQELLGRRRGLVQSSAYRSLVSLEQAGVVRRIVGKGDAGRYELAEELTTHHHHLICVHCGAIADFSPRGPLERRVLEAAKEAAAERGFVHQGHRVDLLGLCSACA